MYVWCSAYVVHVHIRVHFGVSPPPPPPPPPKQVQQVLRDVEEDYRSEVLARLAAMGRAVPEGVDPLDIILEPEGTRWGMSEGEGVVG